VCTTRLSILELQLTCVGSCLYDTETETQPNSFLTQLHSVACKEDLPKMMLRHFSLRSTSGGSQRANSTGPGSQRQGLAPPQAGTRPRSRSLLGSDSTSSTRSESGPTGQGSSFGQHSLPTRSTSQVPSPLSRPVSPTRSESVLDKPIITGVRRRRDSDSDAMQLTPRHTKRLKIEAQQLASDYGIPLNKLLAFLEVSTLFCLYIVGLIQFHAEG